MSKLLTCASLLSFFLVTADHIAKNCFGETKLIGFVNQDTDFKVHVSDVDKILELHNFDKDYQPVFFKYCTNIDSGYLESL